MKKMFLFFLSFWVASATLSASWWDKEPPENLEIGYPGLVYHLAHVKYVQVGVISQLGELVFSEHRRIESVDSIQDIKDVLNEIDVSFGTEYILHDFRYVVKVMDRWGKLMFWYDQSIDFVPSEIIFDQGVYKFPSDRKITLAPFQYRVNLRGIDHAYVMNSDGQAWEVQTDWAGFTFQNRSSYRYLVIAKGGKSYVYNTYTGEQEYVMNLVDFPEINDPMLFEEPYIGSLRPGYHWDRGNIRKFRHLVRSGASKENLKSFLDKIRKTEVVVGTKFQWDLNSVRFVFEEVEQFSTTQYKVFVSYDIRNVRMPWITFEETTGEVFFSVKNERRESPKYVWVTTLEEIREGQGFEVISYEEGPYWNAPSGALFWFQFE